MASAVALPLEKQFATIAGVDLDQLDQLAGQHQHHAAVRAEPEHRRGRAGRAGDDRARARASCRRRCRRRRRTRRSNPGDQPVLFLVLRSATLPLSVINEYAESTIAQRISMVSGVAQVQVFGAAEVRRAHRPRPAQALGPRRSASTRSRSAIQNSNVSLPTGTMYGSQQTFTVLANGQLLPRRGVRADDHRLPQRQPGAARRSRARLRRHRERQDRPPGTRASATIYLAIQKQPGTNVVAVVDAVKQLLPTFREQMPGRRLARHPQRPLRSDPRVGARRQGHAADHRRRWWSW